MDNCDLKNSELEPQFQKYKGRVEHRGDIVDDGSGSCAVFTETRFVCISNDGRKSDGCHCKGIRLCRTSSGRNFSVHPGQNGRCPIVIQKSKVRMSRYLDTSTETQMAKTMHGRPSRSSWAKSVRSSSGRTIKGKAIRESSIGTQVPNCEC